MARKKKTEATPTGRLALTDEQIDKARAMLPGIGRRVRSYEQEIERVKADAKEEVSDLQKKLAPLKEKRTELEEGILNGFLEEGQRELFGDEWPGDAEDGGEE